MAEVLHQDIFDSAQFVLGLLTQQAVSLSVDELKEIDSCDPDADRTISCSVRTVSTFDPSAGCEVELLEYSGLTEGNGLEYHYGIGLSWDLESLPPVDIDLQNKEVLVRCSDGTDEYQEVVATDLEVRTRALGALAAFSDSLL